MQIPRKMAIVIGAAALVVGGVTAAGVAYASQDAGGCVAAGPLTKAVGPAGATAIGDERQARGRAVVRPGRAGDPRFQVGDLGRGAGDLAGSPAPLPVLARRPAGDPAQRPARDFRTASAVAVLDCGF
ncbi:hypothetical protein OG589_25195 [Sphaerisporangium sp. NBC_01403]|uniref:hypothetical protein n=1 Tax=Sphaerisporangium sp. NBC_01403 TaxID=2903599 RepID=UPI0032531AFD